MSNIGTEANTLRSRHWIQFYAQRSNPAGSDKVILGDDSEDPFTGVPNLGQSEAIQVLLHFGDLRVVSLHSHWMSKLNHSRSFNFSNYFKFSLKPFKSEVSKFTVHIAMIFRRVI